MTPAARLTADQALRQEAMKMATAVCNITYMKGKGPSDVKGRMDEVVKMATAFYDFMRAEPNPERTR